MMMMMPRLQKWGSFFLPLKQNLSLSLSLEHKTPNRAREKNFFRDENDDLSLTSLFFFFFFERARREHKFYYSRVRIRVVVFLSSVCLEKWSFLSKKTALSQFLSCVLFCPLFNSFFLRVRFGSFECFFQPTRGRKSRSTPNTIFSRLLWENSLLSLLSIRLGRIIHTITFPYSIFFFFL